MTNLEVDGVVVDDEDSAEGEVGSVWFGGRVGRGDFYHRGEVRGGGFARGSSFAVADSAGYKGVGQFAGADAGVVSFTKRGRGRGKNSRVRQRYEAVHNVLWSVHATFWGIIPR